MKTTYETIKNGLLDLGLVKECHKWQTISLCFETNLSLFRLVVAGQQNSGKSTFLNALCRRTNEDWFETGDRIVTTEIQEREHDGVIYVDTPGYSTTDPEDIRKARTAWQTANVIVFMHSCVLGELNREECETLDFIHTLVDDPARRILALCSKAAEKKQEDLTRILKTIRAQIDASLGESVTLLSVDSKDYLDGLKEHDDRLCSISSIPKVYEWLKDNGSLSNLSQSTFDRTRNEVMSALETKKKIVANDLKELKKAESEVDDSLQKVLSTLWNNSIMPAWNQCRDIYNSLSSLKA